MKNSVKSNLNFVRYRWLGFFIIAIAITYIISDFIEWYIYKSKFILGLNQMPLYRRFLTDLYIMLLGYGGYLLIQESSRSWDLIIISMTSVILSFFMIPWVWGIAFYTNWIEDFPLLLWYFFSMAVVIILVIKRKDFGVSNWIGRLSIILLINIAIRLLHEVIFYNVANV
ncbi:hypothetical protein [Marinifilum sp. D737]|uniref:hypothetical protein n=1 Tax=Marinifilum sp. D737 TaxID=2969628 RepID=UPI002272525D|nr:hypothetical protein [Marinifilum sp. D737]MCY1634876.1 hypothetical protein [Marinifilum sp. D737]